MGERTKEFLSNARRNRAKEHRSEPERKDSPGEKLAKTAARGRTPFGGLEPRRRLADLGKRGKGK